MNQIDLHTYLQMLAAARSPKQKSQLQAQISREVLQSQKPQLTKNTPAGFAGNGYAMNSRRGGLGPYAVPGPIGPNRKGI